MRLGQTGIEVVESPQGIAQGLPFVDAPVGIHVGVHDRQGVAVGVTAAAIGSRTLVAEPSGCGVRHSKDPGGVIADGVQSAADRLGVVALRAIGGPGA